MSLQVEVLEESFEAIKPNADGFVASFYENLFTVNPETRPLFDTTDMEAQKKKLLSSLVLVVENLRKPDALEGALRGLGARHIKYGALPEHYPIVGGALLATFEQYLQEKWTPNVKQAWVDAYGAISEIMLDGADYSQKEIALQSESHNNEIASPETPPVNYSGVNSGTSSVDPSLEASETFSHDSGKATITALVGGAIMGIIATILVLLF